MIELHGNFSDGICLLVEDQADDRDALQKQIEGVFPQIRIVAKQNLHEARVWLSQRTIQADEVPLKLALVDLGLPDGSGIDLIKELMQSDPHVLCVVVTVYQDDAYLFDALAAGAYGYLLKSDGPELLSEVLKRLERQEPPLSPAVARRLLSHFRAPPGTHLEQTDLTPREKETLTLLARGMTVGEVAKRLGLSPQTVAGYVKIIYQKLHVSNRAQATREAIRRGLR